MMQNHSPAKKPIVLVTGGTGFLGAWILRQLVLDGYRVRAIKRNSSELPFFIESSILEKIDWMEGDVLDTVALEEAMKGVDCVIHAAAVVSFHKTDRDRMYVTNITGTSNVVNVAVETGVKRVVYVSSVAALGRTHTGDTVNEKRTWVDNKINTHYAISKYKAELEMWRGMAEGLEGVIINPSTILGYGNWNSSSCAIFKNVYNEFPWYTNGVNGFVYVEDVARAVIDLMDSNITMERFIVSAENLGFREMLNNIADGFGKKQPYREASPWMGQIAWRFERLKTLLTGTRPLLSSDSAKVAQSKTYFDNSKLLKALPGFCFTPLQQAILISCERYLQHHSR